MRYALTAVLGVIAAFPVTYVVFRPHTIAVMESQANAPLIEPHVQVAQHLQNIAVTISVGSKGDSAEGSGFLKRTKDGQVWVWTCGHILRRLREEQADHTVTFKDACISKDIIEDGRIVSERIFKAEVIRFSDSVSGEDLALLRIKQSEHVIYQPPSSVTFYEGKTLPPIGSHLYHCGSLLGKKGSNSVTSGIVSQHGRVLFNNALFDQMSCATFPGSSGGLVTLESDGRCIGIMARGAGEGFSLFIPIRRIQEWAQRVGVAFALDDSLPVPNDTQLRSRPIEEHNPRQARNYPQQEKDFPVCIWEFNKTR